MPIKSETKSALVIGPGPVRIGQGTELDDLCAEACLALRRMGIRVAVVSPNPAAICTEPEFADTAYTDPLTPANLEEIIWKESPDAVFFEFAGPRGLRLASALAKSADGPQRVPASTLARLTDRGALLSWFSGLGYSSHRFAVTISVESALTEASNLGFPLIATASDTTARTIRKSVYNIEELSQLAERWPLSATSPGLTLETLPEGYRPVDCVVLRDRLGKTVVAGIAERLDNLEIHASDTPNVTPPQTLDGRGLEAVIQCAETIAVALEAVGAVEVELAWNASEAKVLPMNARLTLSGTSVFISRASGRRIAFSAAQIACGRTIEETGFSEFSWKKSLSGVAVRFPRWDFERLVGAPDRLGPRPACVGASMAMGGDFIEAFQKAVCGLGNGRDGLGRDPFLSPLRLNALMERLAIPDSGRFFVVYEALCKGADPERIARVTAVHPWFIGELERAARVDTGWTEDEGLPPGPEALAEAKKHGFTDAYLSKSIGIAEENLRRQRIEGNILPAWKPVSTVSTDGGRTGWYATYRGNEAVDPAPFLADERERVLILGAGPNHIGQGGETDYCLTRAGVAVTAAGKSAVIINSNPYQPGAEAVHAARWYIEPVTVETLVSVCQREAPLGVTVQFGAELAIGLDIPLLQAGIPVLGTTPESLTRSKDRDRFRSTVQSLAIPQPQSEMARTPESALSIAERIGYPVLVRTSGAPGVRATEEINDAAMLRHFMSENSTPSRLAPLQIDAFLDNAVELTVDAVSDGTRVHIPAVMEHIELAGIHSGDAALMTPPISIAPKHRDIIASYTREIALAIKARGLFSIEYALMNNTVYVLQVHLGASRTAPFVSKTQGFALLDAAVRVILGEDLPEAITKSPEPVRFAVKEAVFPFDRFPEMVPALGLHMRSTGAALGLGDSFGAAFFKSQAAAGVPLPLQGGVLFSIADRDKTAVLEPVRLFRRLGFALSATPGTHEFLTQRGIACRQIKKIGYGRPNLIDVVKNGEIQLIVNTVADKKSAIDSAYMRKTAIANAVPYITTTASAIAAANGIAALRADARNPARGR